MRHMPIKFPFLMCRGSTAAADFGRAICHHQKERNPRVADACHFIAKILENLATNGFLGSPNIADDADIAICILISYLISSS